MKYPVYQELEPRGRTDFPVAFYDVDSRHPRYEMMLHWHTEHELIWVLCGTLRVQLDGMDFVLHAGESLAVAPGVCHRAQPEACHYQCLVYDPERLLGNGPAAQTLSPLLHGRLALQPALPHTPQIQTLIETLFASSAQACPGQELLVAGALCQLYGTAMRDGYLLSALPAADVPKRRAQHAEQWLCMRRSTAYIREHYAEEITLDTLASAVGMSRQYFCTFFRGMTHTSPMAYLNAYRMERAGEQLLDGNRPITEIAGSCGFSDTSYFSRVFHRHFGFSPREYRKQLSR